METGHFITNEKVRETIQIIAIIIGIISAVAMIISWLL